MKTIILFISLLSSWFTLSAQSNYQLIASYHAATSDTAVHIRKSYTSLTSSSKKAAKFNPVTIVFSSLMYVYQNVLSSQINAGCLYHPSCSEFSKRSIKRFGFLRGVLLTADRMQRCNRISALEYKDKDFNKGRTLDDTPFYE